jgi:hypothetical protein
LIECAGAAAEYITGYPRIAGHVLDKAGVIKRLMKHRPDLSHDEAMETGTARFDACVPRAVRILRKHWADVLYVAELLLFHRILAGVDVIAAMKAPKRTSYLLTAGEVRILYPATPSHSPLVLSHVRGEAV